MVLPLHDAALASSDPLTSMRSLRVHNLGDGHTVEKLLEAMEATEGAYEIMKLFDLYLMVMGVLLDHPGLGDDVNDLFDNERLGAIAIVRDHVMGMVQGCAAR
ncbi:hypothetical protein QYE76_011603 [Lolium multiflorum]|uniref:Uncharacterized protein n=1 Tax=Lolium multiflorum TaxID=4521 RepID=A0AAD8X355_LOLMU|nr:hypothetical protein QYE76_011603 [Lolium multiflorum]